VFSKGSFGVNPVQAAVERTVVAMGYDLVDLEIAGRGLLRVFIDLPVDAQAAPPPAEATSEPRIFESLVRMEDCERVSHQLTHVLTVENIDYARLEVSSPGLDEPLRMHRQYLKNVGRHVEIVKNEGEVVGGVLRKVEGGSIEVEETKGKNKKKEVVVHTIPFDQIKTTKIQVVF
jgi:ribosome maturation factor RimP